MIGYRGRLAPSPTGYLHLGHASTFVTAHNRARTNKGVLVLRNENLDASRCRSHFEKAMLEDLLWFGLNWEEGPDCGGPLGPYNQSERLPLYREVFDALLKRGSIYPCRCSRKDILSALSAPHAGEEEPVYPGICRPPDKPHFSQPDSASVRNQKVNWRFRVADGEVVSFQDGHFGLQSFTAGKDFGDFVIWRHDDIPSYQLAVVADDHFMQISEVVRGADLLMSTARQILIYRALHWEIPAFYHCPLMTDELGVRLAKRHDALSLRKLRELGHLPGTIIQEREWFLARP